MPDRKNELSKMLDTTLKTFTNILSESKDLSKLNSHSKMNLTKAETDAIMSRMIQATQIKVQEKTSELIKENQIVELFEELETLTNESEELNKQLGREAGYSFVKPKRDIALHLSQATEKMLNEADAEIERLEKILNAEEEEHALRKQILTELTGIIESQQGMLRKTA